MMEVRFPGGTAVEAVFRGLTIRTDEPGPSHGVAEPTPYHLFLASIGTCVGFHALRFCQERHIDTSGLKLRLVPEKSAGKRRLARIHITIELPPGFPERDREAIVRATDPCEVTQYIVHPPEFEIVSRRAEVPAALPSRS
jgi:putative redox protein